VDRAAPDAVFVVADGLSARAVQRHAPPLLERVAGRLRDDGWVVGPVVIVEQGRVAVGDEIGEALGARLVAVMIGERPGLSAPDSLGVYLTWDPRPGRTDAERNCISNVRPEGLPYDVAAHRLAWMMAEARRRRLSGVALKEEAPPLERAQLRPLPGGAATQD
jgi:ethanolamine ammonia-lyase small subunit